MNLLLSLFLLSGAAGLIGQVLWVRLFTLIFGSTTVSIATVTAIFLGGLSFGAYEGGAWGREARRPVLWYGGLEIGVAIWVAGVPWAARAFESALMELADVITLSPIMVGMLRAALAVVLVGPPAAAMGATLPLLAAAGPDVRWVGRLYGWNTVGAVAGALAAGYLLIPFLGVNGAALTGAFLNLLAGGGALLRGRRPLGRPGDIVTPETEAPAPRTDGAGWVYAAMALVGAAGLGFEVAWTRALHLILGPSVYAFTAVLAVMLTGLAVGGLAGARLCTGPAESRRRLAWNLWALAAAGLAVVPLFTQLPFLFLELFDAAHGSFWVLQVGYLGLCALVLVVPAALSGAAYPLAVAAAGGRAAAGPVYAWNALGAVAGALAVGHVAVEIIGTQAILKILAGIVAAGAVLVTHGASPSGLPAGAGRRVAPALFLAFLVAAVAIPEWPGHLLLSGPAIRPELYMMASREARDRRAAWTRWMLRGVVASLEEGRNSVIGVIDYPGPTRTLLVSGKPDASDVANADLRTQYLAAHIPLAMHPGPRTVAIIGLGSGATAGAALAHPVREVTCFEIEPAVGRALPYFESINHGCWRDPRLRLQYEDGRAGLSLTSARFDVIISEPSNPWMSGPSRLFTREFYSMVRRRLATDGVFCQWLQLYRLNTADLLMELRTFLSEFPNASLWVTSFGDTLLMAGPDWLTPNYRQFQLRLGRGRALGDLLRIRMGTPEAVLARCVLRGERLRRAAGQGPLNTDEFPRLEYGAIRALYDENVIERHRWLLASWWQEVGPWLAGLSREPSEAARAWLRLSRAYTDLGLATPAVQSAEAALRVRPGSPWALNELGFLALQRGRVAEAARHLEAALAAAVRGRGRGDDGVIHANLAEAYMRLGRRREARLALEQGRRRAPGSALIQHNLGWLRFLEDDVRGAEAALREAIRLSPEDPRPRLSWGRILLERNDARGALEKFLEAVALAPELPEARQGVLMARALLGRMGSRDRRWDEFGRW